MCTVRLRSLSSQEAAKLIACLECEFFFLFLCFFYEIELIPVKFLRYSCEIPTFQTGPKQFRRNNDL